MTDKSYKFYNNLSAWIVFFIALITYTLTVEPTVSLWDCGEFIASSYKLEVGHPPGAPLYMLMGRFFSLFTSSVEHVAIMINYVSVLSSAFTILFIFWTISYFAKKILVKSGEITQSKAFAIFASGAAGALSYTFSDTFWFSAVEAEVYANSSLFTAIVFWAILKWEGISDEKYSNRWLIFIAYMMGLSIGVHLLNLLTIPALVFVYYFKKYKNTKSGIFYASLLSVVLIGVLMYGIIQGYVLLASKFELLFVNGFGLGYNSGLFACIILTFAGLAYGIYYSLKRKKAVLNTILTGIMVILIGYSSFAVIMIRSNANPPMDENNPENVFALLSYLNRDQYGSRPLIYGQYFDADFKRTEDRQIITKPRYTYIPEDGKYKKIEKSIPEYLYDSKRKTFFPRIYSRKPHHISAYQNWATIDKDEEPRFRDNLEYFIKYQTGHMYFRYFMWNFSGRQNNLQSHGLITKGNAITGIDFIDRFVIGKTDKLPDSMKNDKSRNVYYMLPLILGLIGLFFSSIKDKKNFVVLLLLFFFTGIAIVMYLNQTPYQPRERDYAYAGSFYTFSIWIGLGITGIYNLLKDFFKKKLLISLTLILAVQVPVIMAYQNWDDHDRSGRYTARDMAKNYLDSCDENAIMFTYGDNDTFPLWYVQEVENYRTDVKVVNLSLLGSEWYINQMRTKTYLADPIPFKMDHKLYGKGQMNAAYVMNNPDAFLDEKYYESESKYVNDFNEVKAKLIQILEKSIYPEINVEEYKSLNSQLKLITPTQLAVVISNLGDEEFIQQYDINKTDVNDIFSLTQSFLETVSGEHMPLPNAMDFLASVKSDTQLSANNSKKINYLPSKNLSLKVPVEEVKRNGTYNKKEVSMFEETIKWVINNTYIYKNDIAVLEILARNNWERPIYFATSVPSENYYGLKQYFRLEGFAYQLVPYNDTVKGETINTDIMYNKLMNKFSWGRANAEDVYIDNFNIRNFNVMEIRKTFLLLANALTKEDQYKKALEVLDKGIEILPHEKMPYDMTCVNFASAYYTLIQNETADEIISVMVKEFEQKLIYFDSFKGKKYENVISLKYEVLENLKKIREITGLHKRPDLNIKVDKLLELHKF